MPGKKVVIMAGGTGGHVFPALTIAHRLTSMGMEIDWLGTPHGIERRLVTDYPLHTVPIGGLRGKGPGHWLRLPWRFLHALGGALRLLRRVRPALVVGMGGFASGPGGIAAKLLGIPLLIHEQNAVAGTTNRLLAPLADRVLHAFPGTFAPGRRVLCTGNPVREEIARARGAVWPRRQSAVPHLLVLGGSQGAAALNRLLPEALARLQRPFPAVRHQTGVAGLRATREAYARCGVSATLLAFVDDLPALYRWADLVLCRAGAMTVAELAAAGVAAVLVPFPHAADDHQTANARHLSERGAALLLPEAGLDAPTLTAALGTLLADRSRLAAMADQARALHRVDAAQRIVEQCEECLRG